MVPVSHFLAVPICEKGWGGPRARGRERERRKRQVEAEKDLKMESLEAYPGNGDKKLGGGGFA